MAWFELAKVALFVVGVISLAELVIKLPFAVLYSHEKDKERKEAFLMQDTGGKRFVIRLDDIQTIAAEGKQVKVGMKDYTMEINCDTDEAARDEVLYLLSLARKRG